MEDGTERIIGDLRVRIDRLLCVGFGDCIEESAEAFEFDDEGIAVFCDSVDDVGRDALMRACESCPVDALEVYDADGERLVP